jgi:hypothetical protein
VTYIYIYISEVSKRSPEEKPWWHGVGKLFDLVPSGTHDSTKCGRRLSHDESEQQIRLEQLEQHCVDDIPLDKL